MKTLVISYSLTGNNATLAQGIARQLGAEHANLEETRSRSVVTIIWDTLFRRIPSLKPLAVDPFSYDHVIFVAPVWLGAVASPFRGLFRELKGKLHSYSFISFSAGPDDQGPGLEKELQRRLGAKPSALLNPLICAFLPDGPKTSRKELDAYRLTGDEAAWLIEAISGELRQSMAA